MGEGGKVRIVKLILIGFITTVIRSMLQLIIPPGQQTVLAPSAFVKSGTLPLAFMIYGTFAYTMVAVIFLLLQKNMSGNRVIKGLGFGLSCSWLWSIYLHEPLPHADLLDLFIRTIMDIVFVLMGSYLVNQSKNKETPVQ